MILWRTPIAPSLYGTPLESAAMKDKTLIKYMKIEAHIAILLLLREIRNVNTITKEIINA